MDILFNRDIVPNAAELALNPDPGRVKRARRERVKGASALRVGVVVVVLYGLGSADQLCLGYLR